ncbi:MAG: choice-of-anchor J domain-containing protein [Candidatus Cloacimonetes bacterium]|nr:choice-of-anchor J domain-containing protein [Candidatus Cloacimonadota bacterium]
MNKILIAMVILLTTFSLLALNPPRGLTALAENSAALLTWMSPAPEGYFEISYHNGTAHSAFYQHYQRGYGTVFMLDEFEDCTISKIDFFHASFGVNGPHNYKIHVINWETRETVFVTEILATTVNDNWESDINLGNLSYIEQVGIFIEPLSNNATDAYPCISYDTELNSTSEVINLADNTVMVSENHGDFLIDLWIQFGSEPPVRVARKEVTRYNVPENPENISRPLNNDNQGITPTKHRDFLGYNVYRDGEIINSNLVTELSYHDEGLENENPYVYYVTAVYEEGESEPSNTVEVTPISIEEALFEEGFESGNMNEWVLVDNDGDNFNWFIGSVAANGVSPHSGSFCVVSESYNNDSGALTPDNYLISPEIFLNGTGAQLSFWVRTQDNDWPSEHYKVKVSTTGAALIDFVDIIHEETLEAGDWSEVVLDIGNYDGMTIRLAWDHCQSSDMFAMKIDDIRIDMATSSGDNSIPTTIETLISNYPNPFNPNTTISYNLNDNSAETDLVIYNIKGQIVRVFPRLKNEKGKGEVIWSGVDEQGRAVSSGVYLYKLQGKVNSPIQKMILMK